MWQKPSAAIKSQYNISFQNYKHNFLIKDRKKRIKNKKIFFIS